MRTACFSLPGCLFFALLLFVGGCAKEYSATAGANSPGSPLNPPALPAENASLFSCSLCTGAAVSGGWNLLVDNIGYCGAVDTAIVNKERTAFTFFGPSACSLDSGLILSVYLEAPGLNGDRKNLVTNRVAFYYYDNVAGGYALVSRTGKAFQLTIDQYDHASRAATGTFSGYAYTRTGREYFIKSGLFKTLLK